jgi:putative intracellular protease/amidase
VTDSSIAHVVELFAEPFLAADIRLFPFGQRDAPLRWLRTDGRTAVRILVVLTSHDQLGTTGRKTGFWLEELAAPYYVFKDAGASVTLASPKGGQPPLDPVSDGTAAASAATLRFKTDAPANAQLARTLPLMGIAVRDFDAVFYPGGHGPLWDLAEDPGSIALIEAMLAAGKPVAAVCHAPGVLRHVGVRRESVTETAGQLHRAGLIDYRRGHITVLNRDGLENASANATRWFGKNMPACFPTGRQPDRSGSYAIRDVLHFRSWRTHAAYGGRCGTQMPIWSS